MRHKLPEYFSQSHPDAHLTPADLCSHRHGSSPDSLVGACSASCSASQLASLSPRLPPVGREPSHCSLPLAQCRRDLSIQIVPCALFFILFPRQPVSRLVNRGTLGPALSGCDSISSSRERFGCHLLKGNSTSTDSRSRKCERNIFSTGEPGKCFLNRL